MPTEPQCTSSSGVFGSLAAAACLSFCPTAWCIPCRLALLAPLDARIALACDHQAGWHLVRQAQAQPGAGCQKDVWPQQQGQDHLQVGSSQLLACGLRSRRLAACAQALLMLPLCSMASSPGGLHLQASCTVLLSWPSLAWLGAPPAVQRPQLQLSYTILGRCNQRQPATQPSS